MSLAYRIYSDDLSAGEVRLGFVLRMTVNPNHGDVKGTARVDTKP